MGKLFLRILREKDDGSKEIIVYKNIELVFKKGFGDNESLRIKRELKPLLTKSWQINKTTETTAMLTLGEITTNPEKGPKHITYTEIIVEKEYSPSLTIKFSRNGKNAYISGFRSDPDTAINLILKLALENT